MGKKYDAVVIGSGQGGIPLAIELAKQGKQTCLIERDQIGGTCINRGCTPTKTMVASAEAANSLRRAPTLGVNGHLSSIDLPTILRRKDSIIHEFRESSAHNIQETTNLDLIFGNARFIDSHQIEVTTSTDTPVLEADLFFINTGGRPSIPPIPGIRDVPYLTSTSIMELKEIPKRLLVIGGGYIGLEFGQMFHRFGSDVTILQRSKHLLSREDCDISDTVHAILDEEGIDFVFEVDFQRLRKTAEGGVECVFTTPVGEQTLSGSHLLIATGRTPNTDDLNAQAAGVELDSRGFVQVNEFLQTSQPNIYALGDCKGGPAFTHISYDDFRILRDQLFRNGSRSINDRLLPYTVFIDPQLGRVGMTEDEAKKKGLPIQVAKMPMENVARAIELGQTKGLMKVVVHEETNEILGCAILGVEGGELASLIEVAMLGKLPYQTLQDAIFAHPTLAESFNNLFSLIPEEKQHESFA